VINLKHRKSKRLLDRVYLHFDSRFEWPSLSAPFQGEKGFCHALTLHAGIHADGTVVACCLDKEAVNDVGNAFKTSLETILFQGLAKKMREDFAAKKLTQELCQKCTYIKRFE
jgi:radical SAM protein with 4Fe4S-binding SPASM domain